MNKRFILALVLTAIVIVATPVLFPSTARGPVPPNTAGDSAGVAPVASQAPVATTPAAQAPAVAAAPMARARAADSAEVQTVVRRPRATYTFTNIGASAVSIVLDSFASLRPTAGARSVQLLSPDNALSRYVMAIGADTIALDTVAFALQPRVGDAAPVTYSATVKGHPITVSYGFAEATTDDYILNVTLAAPGAPPGSSVFVELPGTIYSNERDTLEDVNHLAGAYRVANRDVESVGFGKLDPAELAGEVGAIDWVATRNKYFLVAFRAGPVPFAQARIEGLPRADGTPATHASVAALAPLTSGTTTFSIYAGPQDFLRLQRLGKNLDQVNPYGSFLTGIVQPFATIVMKALLWMKQATQLNYGWVLILFGILIRVILWPLNQRAMRTSMQMQRLQPEIQAAQKKYSEDPKKQQEAIMKVYAAHGMSPFSPIMGCLPLLIPMPVLFALYHVFQNTIEFRGVAFLWLPDISVKDPYYITPVLMGVTMFLMSWISMRNSPPNPQAKMMAYMMPVMMTVIFLNFASGLNLYYAIQNIAAIPQQWLIARERSKIEPATAVVAAKGRERTT